MIVGIVALAIGIGCLVAAVLAWSGRWSSWSHKFLVGLGAFPVTLLPGIGAGALAGGLNSLGAISASSPVAAVGLVLLLIGWLLFFFSLVRPQRWGPRWYRALDDRWASPELLHDPATAGVVAGVRAWNSRHEGSERAHPPQTLDSPVHSWRGSWIGGDETKPRAHGLTHTGAVEGHLNLHRDAVSFAAYRSEDLLRGHSTVLTIPGTKLRDVRVVPRGAGPDGRLRPGSGPRSLFPRLIIDTGDRSYLFEVQFARRTARRIRHGLGLDREAAPAGR